MAEPKIRTIQARFGFSDPDIKKLKHDEIIKWIIANAEDILMVLFGLSARPRNVEAKWEPLVRMAEDGGQYIGFMDLRIKAEVMVGDIKGKPIFGAKIVLFEAKTVIESLGELFRQLSMYRDGYCGGHPVWKLPVVVVCPDDTEAETIREQGYHFLKYDPTTPFAAGGV